MVFSSILFIIYFLPILLLFYYVIPSKYRIYILLLFSLIFYYIGEPKYIIFLLLSGILNYIFGYLVDKKKSKVILIISLVYNVGQLFVFKYINFFIDNINSITNSKISLLNILLPIGISFYTFQAITYVVDIYNGKHKPAKNIFEFLTYLCFFPQLIAGPIVRYIDIKKDLDKCENNVDDFALGIKRFIIGLSKKVLLANVIGEVIKKLTMTSIVSSWLKPLCYTLQIYFDFSGYSDMAIGLGLMLGFHFLENFNYPLIASSITDFWRRWHISLSSWFRDYVYIPLGGNRTTKVKWIRNIFIVWLLTGFWHGANWNFIIWGIYFAIILLIEKLLIGKYLNKTKFIKYIYSMIIIVISFLIFSIEDTNELINALSNLININNPIIDDVTSFYIRDYSVLFIISIISATPLLKVICYKIKNTKFKIILDIFEPIVLVALFILCLSFIIDESFNPFLYFRF